ncbi:SusC/RagA family TonB-linked outer membrane protein [Sphingobacterium griseoflavum]|uniref:SusC/RagA family TonB-linked outer membrane protein n=1 Tax=Sphingobacterium griseoflavum TaxID=1474952 RepID=A0ABQ3HWC7_9SPHI|nr:SusC/RagA family TonB-linked outer membrane protein [Sphingobacterium griseoflavum]GHE23787.1 SusC/RagA family TonB-linked outer membrane protein [Sphingobacterium griseoflavum]
MSKLYKKGCILSLLMLISISTLFAQQSVTGRVTDANGALAGVTVVVPGTNRSTQTDAQGAYSIQASQGEKLRFTTVGYVAQEIAVSGARLDVLLQEDSGALDEVVVTALGIKRAPKELGYAMSTVGAEELTKTGSPNFAGALYGKAPGVRISAAPGGATSGININIRGVNSITGNAQPLVIIDGVPMRQSAFNNSDFWGDSRARGNGLEDLNPEDIESISVLKGASAAALYGSEALNGVVLVTTKSGKGGNAFALDFNATYTNDRIAYLPRFQDVRGPGYDRSYADIGQDDDMFFYYPDGVRGVANTSLNFGPKFDGQPIRSWDGEIRPYSAQNSYDKFFNNPQNTIFNLALSRSTDKSNTRFSLTRQDNEMTALNSYNKKNIANLNTTFKLWESFTTDVVVNYVNQHTHNRPLLTDRLINNFAGMISPFDNPEWYLSKYQTSLGYKYVTGANTESLTPDENLIYNGYKADVLNYMWDTNAKKYDEYSNRLIGSFTNTWQITSEFMLRGRFSADVTSMRTEDKNPNELPLIYGNSGSFALAQMTGNVYYTDLLASYKKEITEGYSVGAIVGYTATKNQEHYIQRQTEGGLNIRDWFDINASVNLAGANSRFNYRNNMLRDALFGTVNFGMKDFWFVEGTLRREVVSTMHPDNNVIYYPSVNSSLILSEAFQLPAAVSYAKLRGSFGTVGRYPDIYRSALGYMVGNIGNQGTGNSVLYTLVPTSEFGNELIKPETKQEAEFGLEARFFNNRFGFDISYYNSLTKDQILQYTLPNSSGASSVLANVGSLRNTGWEFAFNGTPLSSESFRWTSTLNFAMNRNKIEELPGGSSQLLHRDYDGSAAQLVSNVGQPIGDIMVRPIATDPNGNKIVNANGIYQVDGNRWIKAGNAMPKAVGGFINTFSYKSFTLDALMDFRWGGHVMPTGIAWMTSRGLTEESLNYMDEASGGLSYYINAAGKGVAFNGTVGPNGETVHHDGMLMEGVIQNPDLSFSENTNVISQVRYYANTYNWGGPQYGNSRYELYVQKNNYIKMREISLGYRVPSNVASRLGAKNLQISAFGRNLFFVYRSIKDLDPEQMTGGSSWINQVSNAGTSPATRTYGMMLRASF